MGRESKRLNALSISKLAPMNGDKLAQQPVPGYHADGDGLYLQVAKNGTASWVLRYSLNKRAREMGLGSLKDISLAEARASARKHRQLLIDGIDPIDQRDAERERRRLEAAARRTFEECANEYHTLHAHGWKNAKHAAQWLSTLERYAFPYFGKKDVSKVTKSDILSALEPIWITKAETAARVRQRIRAVMDWAIARDLCIDQDPHLWDKVSRSLPQTKHVKKVTHFAACAYADAGAVLAEVRGSTASEVVKLAFEMLVLCAVRSGDVRGARWCEIDWNGKRWILPADRQKAKREHRVPLAPRVVQILEMQRAVSDEGADLIFPNSTGAPLSDMVFTQLLRRLGHQFTAHGFRSTFRDWCAEQTSFPREVAEAALAHASANGSETEASYFRSDLFEHRRELMNSWAEFLGR